MTINEVPTTNYKARKLSTTRGMAMRRKILNKHFRLNPSTVLFFLLLAVSIMCMPACSSDSDNAEVQPNYIVQATVSFEEDGPVAYALVMDGNKNLVSALNLTINGDPMAIEYLGGDDGESTEAWDGSPIYTIDLSDLKGGDMVVFEARDQFGVIIYAPEPAVIPMAIELLEPEEGQEIMAGDEVIIRWTGGEGAEVLSAAYATLEGSTIYKADVVSGSVSATIPAGQTGQGEAILGVGAISGEVQVVDSFAEDWISRESYFLISRESGIEITIRPPSDFTPTATSYDYSTSCEQSPEYMNKIEAAAACTGSFAALGIGAIIWENRRQCELNNSGNEPCRNTTNNWVYCMDYSRDRGQNHWYPGCMECCKRLYPEQNIIKWSHVWRNRFDWLVRPCRPAR